MLRPLTEAFTLLYIMCMSDAIKQQFVNSPGKYDKKQLKELKSLVSIDSAKSCCFFSVKALHMPDFIITNHFHSRSDHKEWR